MPCMNGPNSVCNLHPTKHMGCTQSIHKRPLCRLTSRTHTHTHTHTQYTIHKHSPLTPESYQALESFVPAHSPRCPSTTPPCSESTDCDAFGETKTMPGGSWPQRLHCWHAVPMAARRDPWSLRDDDPAQREALQTVPYPWLHRRHPLRDPTMGYGSCQCWQTCATAVGWAFSRVVVSHRAFFGGALTARRGHVRPTVSSVHLGPTV